MKVLFWLFLLLPFFFINYQIIKTDVLEQKIPNKLLLFLSTLLPFWYIYAWFYGYFWEISYLNYGIQIILIFIVTYAIYEFQIWWAWDAKYLCILWLFIPHIWVLDLIWNIALITLVYLGIYFLWFWFGKNLWIKQKRKEFYTSLWTLKKEDFVHKNKNLSSKEIRLNFLKWLNIFLLVFLGVRFLRIYVITYLSQKYDILFLLQEYWIYILIAWVSLLFTITIISKKVIQLFRKYIFKEKNTEIYFICFLSFFAISILLYGFIQSPDYFSEKIIIIFTLYLFIYILISFFYSAIKIVFKMQEQPLVHVNDLKAWMMIDKQWFDIILSRDRHLFPWISISSRILTQEDVETVQKVIATVYEEDGIEYIPTYKTFGFGIFIFIGLIITFFYKSLFISMIVWLYKFFVL